MKYLFKLSCLALLISLSSCNQDKFEPDYTNGKATALRNGETWIGKGRGTINNQGIGIDMYYDVFDDFGQLRQNLFFRKIPPNSGVYPIFNTSTQAKDSIPGCIYMTFSFDGDVIEDVYKVVESETESTVTVLSYDESTRLFTGKFKLKLYKDPNPNNPTPNNPDTIFFKTGEFEVKIEE